MDTSCYEEFKLIVIIIVLLHLVFSRFCMNLTPVERRERIPVNVNLKGLLSGKKNGSS